MAAIGIALWKYVMKYSPKNPAFFNRDRFVLSNGHTCLFQYAFLHLTGYEAYTMDQLKSYHSTRTDSLCPGHPEIELPGVEVTTGPLGQGIANAVGLAAASKHLGTVYNRPGYPLVDNTTWCMIGDACLQEGVAMEAIQLAGHWRLDNLVVIYDNNQVSCDGSIDLSNTEDINAKMRSCNWEVIEVEQGSDVDTIVTSLSKAQKSDKPAFVNVQTVIGIGSVVAGDAKAHGAAFGADEVANIKRTFGLDPAEHFTVCPEVYEFFADAKQRGSQMERRWAGLLDEYAVRHPELFAEFKLRVEGKPTANWEDIIPPKEQLPTEPTPSRKSAGLICNPLASAINSMMVGTADLSPSVNMIWKGKEDFQRVSRPTLIPCAKDRSSLFNICLQQPDLKTTCGINGSYAGRYIHYGIREHAMAAISNGLAAFNKGTILPVTSTFFMFYIVCTLCPQKQNAKMLLLTDNKYAAPAVRMGALQGLQQIHIATHDSIGTGEDGPTHQPIALAALYRAMPNILYIRPCDSEEVAGAFVAALQATSTPSIISLSRQAIEQYPKYSRRDGVLRGGYVFIEDEAADVTLIGVGAEMCFAVRTAKRLLAEHNTRARVVSLPCQRLFDLQPAVYKRQVLRHKSGPVVAIEAYSANGWERYADAAFSMQSFGHSLPGKEAYEYFGFDDATIAPTISEFVEEANKLGLENLRGEFKNLNPVHRGYLEY